MKANLLLIPFLLLPLTVRAAEKIADVAPPASQLGADWKRETALLIEDLNAPPKPPTDREDGKAAAEALAFTLPLLKARKVAGAGNFIYELTTGGKTATLDVYFYRFGSGADAKEFWDKAPARAGTPFAVGEAGQLAVSGGVKVLTFLRRNFYVKITVLGSDAGLDPLARAIDARLSK